MKRNSHQVAGIGLALSALLGDDQPEHPIDFSLLLVGGLFGSRLPDLLEPATNPHHRKVFHSVAIGLMVAYGIKSIWNWSPESRHEQVIKWAGLGLCLGYASHLALDASTPKSLPLIGVE